MKDILDNVSLFWSKYFKDSEILHSLVDAAITRISEFKQDNASYLLSLSADSFPLTIRRDLFFLQLEDSNFKIINTMDPSLNPFLIYDLGNSDLRSLPFILPSPTSEVILENGVDYEFFKGNDKSFRSDILNQLNKSNCYIMFHNDPRTINGFRSEVE